MHEKDQFSSKESVSNDSLECVSDNGGDSLDSSAQSEDSLQILDDSLGKIKLYYYKCKENFKPKQIGQLSQSILSKFCNFQPFS